MCCMCNRLWQFLIWTYQSTQSKYKFQVMVFWTRQKSRLEPVIQIGKRPSSRAADCILWSPPGPRWEAWQQQILCLHCGMRWDPSPSIHGQTASAAASVRVEQLKQRWCSTRKTDGRRSIQANPNKESGKSVANTCFEPNKADQRPLEQEFGDPGPDQGEEKF